MRMDFGTTYPKPATTLYAQTGNKFRSIVGQTERKLITTAMDLVEYRFPVSAQNELETVRTMMSAFWEEAQIIELQQEPNQGRPSFFEAYGDLLSNNCLTYTAKVSHEGKRCY